MYAHLIRSLNTARRHTEPIVPPFLAYPRVPKPKVAVGVKACLHFA